MEGLFDSQPMLRRLQGERALIISGPRALTPGRLRLIPAARAA